MNLSCIRNYCWWYWTKVWLWHDRQRIPAFRSRSGPPWKYADEKRTGWPFCIILVVGILFWRVIKLKILIRKMHKRNVIGKIISVDIQMTIFNVFWFWLLRLRQIVSVSFWMAVNSTEVKDEWYFCIVMYYPLNCLEVKSTADVGLNNSY